MIYFCVPFFFPLLQALLKPNNFRITHGTFKSMSKVLCNQEITPLFFESLLPDFGDPVRNSSSVEDVHVQKMMRKYGIPYDSSKSGFFICQVHFKAKLSHFQRSITDLDFFLDGSWFMLVEDLPRSSYWWLIFVSIKRQTACTAQQCLILQHFPFVDGTVLGLGRLLFFLDT